MQEQEVAFSDGFAKFSSMTLARPTESSSSENLEDGQQQIISSCDEEEDPEEEKKFDKYEKDFKVHVFKQFLIAAQKVVLLDGCKVQVEKLILSWNQIANPDGVPLATLNDMFAFVAKPGLRQCIVTQLIAGCREPGIPEHFRFIICSGFLFFHYLSFGLKFHGS